MRLFWNLPKGGHGKPPQIHYHHRHLMCFVCSPVPSARTHARTGLAAQCKTCANAAGLARPGRRIWVERTLVAPAFFSVAVKQEAPCLGTELPTFFNRVRAAGPGDAAVGGHGPCRRRVARACTIPTSVQSAAKRSFVSTQARPMQMDPHNVAAMAGPAWSEKRWQMPRKNERKRTSATVQPSRASATQTRRRKWPVLSSSSLSCSWPWLWW